MRHGMSPKDAILDTLKRVSRNFNNDRKRLEAVDLNFYALSKTGEYAGGSLWGTLQVCGRHQRCCRSHGTIGLLVRA